MDIYKSIGIVQVYENNGVGWNQIGSNISGKAWTADVMQTSINAKIGFYPNSIDINGNGNFIVVASSNSSDKSEMYVEVYKLNNNNWSKHGQTIEAGFGSRTNVSINDVGDRISIGDPDNKRVFVYKYNLGVWEIMGAPIISFDETFGFSAKLSDSGFGIVIGAPKKDYKGRVDNGGVYVYQWDLVEWKQIGSFVEPQNID